MSKSIVNNKVTYPPYLKAGDSVGIFAPAKFIDKEKIDNAVNILQSWGLNVVVGQHVAEHYNQFAGNDKQRAADLQSFINNPDIKAIICARGGYGCIRTLEYVDFTPLINQPKWLVGYSDVTVYHTLLNCKYNIATIHGTMPLNFPQFGENNESINTLYLALFGDLKEYTLKANSLNITGQTTGRLIGGNLSIIQSVAATPADIIADGAILFIEDVDEYLYHIDRMMMNLKYSGKLSRLNGIIVGGMTDIKDNNPPFGKNVNELIRDYATEANIPAIFDFPSGHQDVNWALYFGRTITLDVKKDSIQLSFI